MSLLDDIKTLRTYPRLEFGARIHIMSDLRDRGEPIPEWLGDADIEFIEAELITCIPIGHKWFKRWPARKNGIELTFVSPKPEARGKFVTTLQPREWTMLFERHG